MGSRECDGCGATEVSLRRLTIHGEVQRLCRVCEADELFDGIEQDDHGKWLRPYRGYWQPVTSVTGDWYPTRGRS